MEKPNCGQFSPDAIFAILSYDWPNNYNQLRMVIKQAVNESADEPISYELIKNALNVDELEPKPAAERLETFLKRYQAGIIRKALSNGDVTLNELTESLELSSVMNGNEHDLTNVPLVNPDLAKI